MDPANTTGFPQTAKENSKILLIIRHAKSSWDAGTLSDFERPLNERGKKDAPEMAQRLKDKNIQIDAFIASPALRAKKTAELFADVYGRNKEDIIFISKLYHATTDTFFEVVSELDDDLTTVAIYSHNPGITDFVNLLVHKTRLDNMPTCSVFAVKLNDSSWKNFKKGNRELLFFDYPKSS